MTARQSPSVVEGGESPSTRSEIHLVCELPPSTNALYQKRRGGGQALTKVATKFREGVKKLVAKKLPELITFPVDPETIYQFDIALYFEKLENPGWFEFWEEDTYVTRGKNKGDLKGRAGERKAQSRYKKIDYDNRIKFLQDCVVKSIGIPDDSQVFRGVQEKREDPHNPRAEIAVRVKPRTQFFTERR